LNNNKTISTNKRRIEAYDVARALAILGMIIVNFKIVMDSSEAGSELLVFLTYLIEGRAAALFVILAGVSLSLMTRRAREADDDVMKRQSQWGIFKRSLFLLVFGFLLTPIWPADILHFYSLYLAFGTLLIFASKRRLWLAIVIIMTNTLILFVLFDYSAGWDWDTFTITDFWTPVGLVRHLLFNGFHPFFPWASFLLIGIWLGRKDIKDIIIRRRLLVKAILALVITEITSFVLYRAAIPYLGAELSHYFFGRDMIPPTIFYVTSAGSLAIIIILLLVEINQRMPSQRWWNILSITGRFALTLYVAHIILGMGMMEAFGWIEGGKSLAFTLIYACLFYVAGITFSLLWNRRFKRGPFEQFMRRITGLG